MVETHWDDLRGREVRYRDHTWELTGEVEVRNGGESLAVTATQVDDVRHSTADLHFGLRAGTESLNPGDPGEHFDRLERAGGVQQLVVRKRGRTYRYELHGMAYE